MFTNKCAIRTISTYRTPYKMTKTLNTINGIDINQGGGMAKGLYNLSKDGKLTMWFDEETLDNLMDLSDERLEEEFNKMVRR